MHVHTCARGDADLQECLRRWGADGRLARVTGAACDVAVGADRERLVAAAREELGYRPGAGHPRQQRRADHVPARHGDHGGGLRAHHGHQPRVLLPPRAAWPEAPPPAGSRVRPPPGPIRRRLRPCGRSGLQHGRRARASARVRDHGGAAHPLAPLQCLPLASPHRLPPSSAPSCSSACRMHSRREVMYFCIPSLLQRQNASRDA